MASQQQVKQYLAYWFQLGKGVVLSKSNQRVLPNPIFEDSRYSSAFEVCWRQILDPQTGDCHLEGSQATIQDLLSPTWDMTSCARCDMPVPTIDRGIQEPECTCSDLPLWPNNELPFPRAAISSETHLDEISTRLRQIK